MMDSLGIMHRLECRKLANILGRIVELMTCILHIYYSGEALGDKLPRQLCVTGVV